MKLQTVKVDTKSFVDLLMVGKRTNSTAKLRQRQLILMSREELDNEDPSIKDIIDNVVKLKKYLVLKYSNKTTLQSKLASLLVIYKVTNKDPPKFLVKEQQKADTESRISKIKEKKMTIDELRNKLIIIQNKYNEIGKEYDELMKLLGNRSSIYWLHLICKFRYKILSFIYISFIHKVGAPIRPSEFINIEIRARYDKNSDDVTKNIYSLKTHNIYINNQKSDIKDRVFKIRDNKLINAINMLSKNKWLFSSIPKAQNGQVQISLCTFTKIIKKVTTFTTDELRHIYTRRADYFSEQSEKIFHVINQAKILGHSPITAYTWYTT